VRIDVPPVVDRLVAQPAHLGEALEPVSDAGPLVFSRAGTQLDFPAQQIQGVAEVWVPFEESIAIGW
jgi:hypothetical protein